MNSKLILMPIKQLTVFDIYSINPYICKQANLTAFWMVFSSQSEELLFLRNSLTAYPKKKLPNFTLVPL